MALAVVVDGKAVEVREPRVCRMIQRLVEREEQIRAIEQGRVEFHFAAPTQLITVNVVDSDRM
jgi:hypothetical protein